METAKTFVDIVIDHITDIRVSLIEIHETNPKSSLRHLALVIYKTDPINIIANEKVFADKREGGWTLFMDQDSQVDVSLLGTTARIFRDAGGSVFLELSTSDYEATFKLKGISATEDLPF